MDELLHFGQATFADADPFIKISPVDLKRFPGIVLQEEGTETAPVLFVCLPDQKSQSTSSHFVTRSRFQEPGNEVHSFEFVRNLEENAVMMEVVIKELGLKLRGQPGHKLGSSVEPDNYAG